MIMTLPVGGFLVLGCLIAVMQWAHARPKKKEERNNGAGLPTFYPSRWAPSW